MAAWLDHLAPDVVPAVGLDVFSTHLAAAPTDGLHRRLQVVEIDRYVREIRGDRDDLAGFGTTRESMPPILCGDFNAEPDSDEIRFLSSLTSLDGRTTFWQDAWRMAGNGGTPAACSTPKSCVPHRSPG